MKVHGILIDVSGERGTVKETDVNEGDLDEFYKILDCYTIDIVQRTINGKVFDIVCDDEALLKDDPTPSAVRKDGKIMLVGNLFICNHYKEYLTSLSKEDCRFILDNVAVVSTAKPHEKKVKTHPVVLNTEYVRIM